MSLFTKEEYDRLHSLVFVDGYSGYKPEVKEIPNGDGKVDADKRYAHVAPKYFKTDAQREALEPFLKKAFNLARAAADLAKIPPQFMPDYRYGALRILDYPPGAVSNKHEDFDLFTLMIYRDQPDRFIADEVPDQEAIRRIRLLNEQAHLGQLGEAVGLGQATPHEVLASDTRQCSIVYFAIPDWESVLPDGTKVVDWLNERMARSRTAFDKYKPAT
jgi:hypothetical protein